MFNTFRYAKLSVNSRYVVRFYSRLLPTTAELCRFGDKIDLDLELFEPATSFNVTMRDNMIGTEYFDTIFSV